MALDRDLALLHRLEQGRLGLGWRTVDLVAEQQVGEDRAGPELEVAGPLVVDGRPGDVRRHQVGRELDARELEVGHLRERAREQGLGEAGIVLEQDVAVGEEAHEHELEHVPLAHDRALDLVEDALREGGDALELCNCHV